ncbi:hypothetical protein SC206_08630 [Rouxiella sp. T17]|uniref:hypothetical protein n=1 Tax=Rouxiella sp. T17 TaxID=3085684 RepID=UPI002FCA7F67
MKRLFITALWVVFINLIAVTSTQAVEMFIGGESSTPINEEQLAKEFLLTGDFTLFLNKKLIRDQCISIKSFIITWTMPNDIKTVYIQKLGREGSHWKSAVKPNTRVQPRIKVTGIVTNRCKSPQKISLEVLLFMRSDPNDEKRLFLKEILLPSPEICSVRLTPDVISFGTISAGQNYYEYINYEGNGDVAISSPFMKNGRLLLNNDPTMEISVPSTFNSTNNSWETSQHQGGIPLTLKVDKAAKAGNYKAHLTATLSCP